MSSARVGIVTPAYNAARFLGQTLDAVLAQTRSDWQCVVVDDGSSDTTLDLARAYAARDSRIAVVAQATNGGVSRARSAGLASLPAELPFIVFLDADDVWHPEAIASLLAALEANASAPAAHALAEFIDANGDTLVTDETRAARLRRLVFREDGSIVEPPVTDPTTSQMLATWPCVITPGVVLIRRAAFDAAGGWDATLSIGEDWELWYRLSLLAPLAFVPRALIRFRIYPSSSSSTWRRPLRLAKARTRVLNADASSPEQRRYARRAYRAMSRRLGRARLCQGLSAIARLDVRGALRGLGGGAANLLLSLKPL